MTALVSSCVEDTYCCHDEHDGDGDGDGDEIAGMEIRFTYNINTQNNINNEPYFWKKVFSTSM